MSYGQGVFRTPLFYFEFLEDLPNTLPTLVTYISNFPTVHILELLHSTHYNKLISLVMDKTIGFAIRLRSAPLLRKRRQFYEFLLFPVPKDTIKRSHPSTESHRQHSHSHQTVLLQKQRFIFPNPKAKSPQAAPSTSLNHFYVMKCSGLISPNIECQKNFPRLHLFVCTEKWFLLGLLENRHATLWHRALY